MAVPPDITVSIRCVNDSVPQFRECLDALKGQEGVNPEVWIIDSSDHKQFEEICTEYDFVHHSWIEGKNLCEGRNKGTELAAADYVALTDPDCVPVPGWLKALKDELDAGAAVTGGRVVPRWLAKPPWYIRASRIARTHLSLRDMGDEVMETDRVFGANMAFSKSRLGENARFREDLDRVDGILIGGGDTEFCERALAAGGKVTYTPAAQVEHQIPPRRLTFGWTLKRVFYGGVSRTFRGGKPKAVAAKKTAFADLLFMAVFALPYKFGQWHGHKLKKRVASGKSLSGIGKSEFNDSYDKELAGE